jgi:hypothetical protein
MSTFARSMAGTDAVRGRPVRSYGRGRRCATEGCGTRLSLYNPKERCALCMMTARGV